MATTAKARTTKTAPAAAVAAPTATLAAALHTVANTLTAPHAVGPVVAYTVTAKAAVIAPHLTLQRGCTVPVGAQWRNNGHKATNTRAIVMQTLLALGSTFTHTQAVAALAPLKAQAILGSGTPASYLRAFVKSGYLVAA